MGGECISPDCCAPGGFDSWDSILEAVIWLSLILFPELFIIVSCLLFTRFLIIYRQQQEVADNFSNLLSELFPPPDPRIERQMV